MQHHPRSKKYIMTTRVAFDSNHASTRKPMNGTNRCLATSLSMRVHQVHYIYSSDPFFYFLVIQSGKLSVKDITGFPGHTSSAISVVSSHWQHDAAVFFHG